MTTMVLMVAAILIVAIVAATVREVFADAPAHACRGCGNPIRPDRDFCDACLNARLREDVQVYVQQRRRDPELYERIVKRLLAEEETQLKSEKAGELGSAPALAPTPKDLRSR